MNLKVSSGVRISIGEDQGTKVMIFDQPVRTLSLEPDEAAKIGASLYRDKRSAIFPSLVTLVESGFFDEPRTLVEIRSALKSFSPNLRPSSVVMSLTTLCHKRIINRTGKRRNYRYKRT